MKKVLRILLIILIVLIIIAGCSFGYLYFNGLSGMNRTSEPDEKQIKVACVGDSTTYGHGIQNWPENNYPSLLQDLLGDEYHVNNFAVSGRAVQKSSDQPYTALKHYQASLSYQPDILVFMMGCNDSKPENWYGADTFKSELSALLDSYGDAEIYLCTPTASFFLNGQNDGVTNFDIQPLIVAEIADIVREAAGERNCTLIDIYALTEAHPEWFNKDGVHPNNDGAAAIAQEVYHALKNKQPE